MEVGEAPEMLGLTGIWGSSKLNLLNPDVTFEVGTKPGKISVFEAHRSILARASGVFEAMFYGPMSDDSKYKKMFKVQIKDVEPGVFEELLKYIYMKKANVTGENALHLLNLTDKYMIQDLREICFNFIERNLDSDNFCTILDPCILLNDAEFKERLLLYYRENATSILQCKSFPNISRVALLHLIQLDIVNAKEIDLYKGCCIWTDQYLERLKTQRELERDVMKMFEKEEIQTMNSVLPSLREILGEEIIQNIRFPSMSKNEFLSALKVAPLLNEEEIQSIKYAIATRRLKEDLAFSMKPRQDFVGICACRSDVSTEVDPSEGDLPSKTVLASRSTIYLTGIKVTKRPGYDSVWLELEKSDGETKSVIGRGWGSTSEDRIRFERPLKLIQHRKYKISVIYNKATDMAMQKPTPTTKTIIQKAETNFIFFKPDDSTVQQLFYHSL